MSTPEPLAKLPEQITGLTGKIPGIGRTFTADSVDRWFREPGRAEINYLRGVDANWHINFSKTGASTILFIFRREKTTWVMLDAKVALGATVASPIETPPKPAIQDIQRRISFPTFLWTTPSAAEVQLFGPPGATRDNTVFFKLGIIGQNILAILNPESGKKAKLRYSPQGTPGPVEPQGGDYLLASFLDLTQTIRDWLAQGKPTSKAVQLVGTPTTDTPVHKILTALLQAYVDSNADLISKKEEMEADETKPEVFQSYLIRNYEIALKLRLKADGSLAEKKDEEQFQLVIDAGIAEGPPTTAALILEPPDFLIDGPLFDAFFSALTPETEVRAIAHALEVEWQFIRPFLAEAKPSAAIFRTSRDDDHDRDTLMLSGQLRGVPTTAIINAKFRVNVDKTPPSVELDVTSVDGRRIIGDNPGTASLEFDDIKYYLQLASGLRRWLGVLGEW